MNAPGSSAERGSGPEGVAIVDEAVLMKLLVVASAAFVYRQQTEVYMARQAALIERGATVDEMVTANWQLFEEVARAEQRLFEAIDDLENFQQ